MAYQEEKMAISPTQVLFDSVELFVFPEKKFLSSEIYWYSLLTFYIKIIYKGKKET